MRRAESGTARNRTEKSATCICEKIRQKPSRKSEEEPKATYPSETAREWRPQIQSPRGGSWFQLTKVGRARADLRSRPGLREHPMLDRFRASPPDFHIDARAEPIDDRDEAIHREPPQVRIPNPREVSRRDPRSAMRGAYSQVFPIECLYDFGGQNSLELFGVGVLMPQIAEHIAASPHHSQLFIFHRNISFNL